MYVIAREPCSNKHKSNITGNENKLLNKYMIFLHSGALFELLSTQFIHHIFLSTSANNYSSRKWNKRKIMEILLTDLLCS